jgi:predicted GIY-YIG superfamily endonuclease
MTGIVVYGIVHAQQTRSYVGWTNDWPARLRKHRREIRGGARATGAVADPSAWQPLFVVTGFKTPRHARQLEWLLHDTKHAPAERRRKRGETPRAWRLRRLADAFAQERFTADAPRTAEAELTVIHEPNT